MFQFEKQTEKALKKVFKNNKIIFSASVVLVLGLGFRVWNAQPVFLAYACELNNPAVSESLFFEKQPGLASKLDRKKMAIDKQPLLPWKDDAIDLKKKNESTGELAQKLYAMVGDYPIREMVPFISMRDEKVAAFLVGIAKKESGWGQHAPSQNGQDCYNYWGYKGSAGNGSSLGYACFSSAEEAIEIVGNRLEVLVGKNRNTPAKMVNTWKCGTDCSGDPGAPSWVSTVALYFNKIVS